MNKFIGVGTLPRNGIVNGSDKKILRFTLATLVGHNKKTKKDMWSYVPCVVFKPAEKTVSLLTEETKGVMIGLEGRVNTSKFETREGQTKYSTEVIVDERSIRLMQINVSEDTVSEKVS